MEWNEAEEVAWHGEPRGPGLWGGLGCFLVIFGKGFWWFGGFLGQVGWVFALRSSFLFWNDILCFSWLGGLVVGALGAMTTLKL